MTLLGGNLSIPISYTNIDYKSVRHVIINFSFK